MADSDTLRKSKAQHKPKNVRSKADDKDIHAAMQDCIRYLQTRLDEQIRARQGELIFKEAITYREMMEVISVRGIRKEFDYVFSNRSIKPDGGLIVLRMPGQKDKIILVSEVKRQGTNDARLLEGKRKQAQGNAIERLGKNLIGIRAMLKHETITPFVCFGRGVRFHRRKSG